MEEYGNIHQYWHATMNEVGIESSPDNLSGKNVGAWNMMNSVDPSTQARSFAGNAYYLPAAHRYNLHLVTETMAREILLEKNEDEWVAKGVRLRCKDEELTASAKREIIVCAGAIQSPQLLEMSGIGDPRYLEPAGIEVKVRNLNVGENLREHMGMCEIQLAKGHTC
jgi:choline dehydrogenase-like flavoprotein